MRFARQIFTPQRRLYLRGLLLRLLKATPPLCYGLCAAAKQTRNGAITPSCLPEFYDLQPYPFRPGRNRQGDPKFFMAPEDISFYKGFDRFMMNAMPGHMSDDS